MNYLSYNFQNIYFMLYYFIVMSICYKKQEEACAQIIDNAQGYNRGILFHISYE